MSEEFNVDGQIISYIYRNDSNGYKIAKLKSSSGDILTITGYFPELSSELEYHFELEKSTHPKYGIQWKVISFKKSNELSIEGIIDYLSSDLFEGIGPKTARKIVDAYGTGCIEKIIENKELLTEIGINGIKKERFYAALKLHSYEEKILITLYSFGLGTKTAMKLFQKYQEKTLDILYENPYRFIEDIEGFSFKKADELALHAGIDEKNPFRIDSALLFALKLYCYQTGDTYILKPLFMEITLDLLDRNFSIPHELVEEELLQLVTIKKILYIEDKYILPEFYVSELVISDNIHRLQDGFKKSIDQDLLKIGIQHATNLLGIEYSPLQLEAIQQSLEAPVSIITGGPGTGKTTVIKGILHTYEFLYDINLGDGKNQKIALIAPTGRASKRMYESCQYPACTIHRLLGYDYSGEFEYTRDNLLPYDLIIVDESSMIDIFLAKNLLDAIKTGAQVIFVGDENQLPSVSPGQFLHDIICSEILPITKLTEIHRQAQDSYIIQLSYAVNEGMLTERILDTHEDVSFIKCSGAQVLMDMKSLILELKEEDYDLQNDVQILAPMYKGELGIDRINQEIQALLNPPALYKGQIQIGEVIFRKGDKVLQIVNNPQKEVMNGDVGFISDIKKDDLGKEYIFVNFDGRLVQYDKDSLEELRLAYAISIHKSQGSEYKVVILPIVRSYYMMLKRKLIYTGITRAKKKLYLLGDLYALSQGIRFSDEKRNTLLMKLLTKYLEEEPVQKYEKKIYDPDIPFDTLGEEMENITPYDFMKK